MKVLILAGGYGTRLSEQTDTIPKPMVLIGGMPIIWHIMKIYSHFGFNDFVILLGYKGYVIKEFFANYYLHHSNVTFDMSNNRIQVHTNSSEPWKVTLLDTGLDTMTGGRIKRAAAYIQNQPFMVTYGDGVANVDIAQLVQFHKSHGKAITLTSVQPEERYGLIQMNEQMRVTRFVEKPKDDSSWINGGFFVCEPSVLNYISDDSTIFERKPLEQLAADGQLYAYKHTGFWRAMDTLRDERFLNKLWNENKAEWKIW